MIRRPTPLAVASHECGHAIARLALSDLAPAPMLKLVSIVPTGGWVGETVMDRRIMMMLVDQLPPMPDIPRGIRLDIIETLAGPIAETRHCTQSWLSGLMQKDAAVGMILERGQFAECDQDAQDAVLRLEKLLSKTPCDPRQTLSRLWSAAWALVEIEWQGIRRMSKAMVDQQVMDGEAFRSHWLKVRPALVYRRRAEKVMGEAVDDLRWACGLGEVAA